jgi:hypothetical protein
MLWAAVQGGSPYDVSALQARLNWGTYPVAFIYPPSALPVFAVFGLLPFRVAITTWAALSAAAMAAASRSNWAPLLLLTPAALWALPGGQVSVLLGALLFGALTIPRPAVAGTMLGLALSLKPQLAAIVPLVLLLNQRWMVLALAVGTFLFLSVVSGSWFGFNQWLEWLRSLPTFLGQQRSISTLHRNEIAADLSIPLRIAAFAVGTLLATISMKRDNAVAAFVASVGTALICSPHAMGYEFAMFTPGIPSLLKRHGLVSLAIVIFIAMPALIWAGADPQPWRLVSLCLLVFASQLPWQERQAHHSPSGLTWRRRLGRDRACG